MGSGARGGAGREPRTRLCVKNLPTHLNEDRLREIFSEHGAVTDVRIMRTADKRSRKFGFVGFADEAAAKRARHHRDLSYIDTSKITVEFALRPGSERLGRAWSKYSRGSSRHMRDNPELYQDDNANPKAPGAGGLSAQGDAAAKSRIARLLGAIGGQLGDKGKALAKDPKFLEFLHVMGSRGRRGKFWENDDALQETMQDFETYKHSQGDGAKAGGVQASTSLVPNRKRGGEGLLVQRTHIKFGSDDDESDGDGGAKSDAGPAAVSSVGAAGASALDWLKTKVVREMSDDDNDGDGGGGDGNRRKPAKKSAPRSADRKDKFAESKARAGDAIPLSDSGRLFVRNLPFAVTETALEDHFKRFGELSDVHVPLDAAKRSKGYAYIQFMFPEDAIKALGALDGTIFAGRILHILAARRKIATEETGDVDGQTFKQKKRERLKKESTNEDSWNSLFVRSDTAIEATAAELGVSKGQILDKEGGNMAVKAALAETQVIERTKQYLKDQGVDVAKFSGNRSGSKRSKTVIIVKNIPFAAEPGEVRDLFAAHGAVGRIVVPPSRALAIVEMVHQQEARLAFRRLAYKRFKHVPLFLEWAPAEVLVPGASAQDAGDAKAPAGGAALVSGEAAGKPASKAVAAPPVSAPIASSRDAGYDDDEEDDSRSVYVKNLSFQTTDDALRRAFRGVSGLKAATIIRKRNPKFRSQKPEGPENSKTLSLGYGFLEFASPRDARLAVSAKQDIVLDGHTLSLKLSRRKTQEQKRAAGSKRKRAADGKSSSKLLARNIAFQANQRELRELFGAYGQLKKLRLPRKFDGTHRGFCFVEYLTEQEAKSAKTALENSHFYGRHLVLEWAKADDTLEELRQKTKDAYDAAAEATEAGVKAAAPSSRGAALTTGMFSKRKRAKLGGSKG